MYVYMLNEKLISRWSLNSTLPVGKAQSFIPVLKSSSLWPHWTQVSHPVGAFSTLLSPSPKANSTSPGHGCPSRLGNHSSWWCAFPCGLGDPLTTAAWGKGLAGKLWFEGKPLQLSGFPIPRWFLWQTKASSSSCFQSQVVIAACPSPRTHPFPFRQPNSLLFFPFLPLMV